MSKYEKAIAFASMAHDTRTKDGKPQMYDGAPYSLHLSQVASVISRFEWYIPIVIYDDLRAAAWLHDTLEDTTVTHAELEELFGPDVARLVRSVTNDGVGSRSDQFKRTYGVLRSHLNAIILKLADRIANVEASVRLHFYKSGSKHYLGMYIDEYSKFRDALYIRGHVDEMWDHLDGLLTDPKYAFYEVLPRELVWSSLLPKSAN